MEAKRFEKRGLWTGRRKVRGRSKKEEPVGSSDDDS